MEVTRIWWVGTLAVVVLLLLFDLVVTRRQNRRPTHREAALGVAFYTGTALVFALVLIVGFGARSGGEFAAGWLTEYSLSIDNLFVFMVLINRFSVPAPLQPRVLTTGIVLALVLRGLLIAAGSAAIAAFSWVFYLFGVFLLWTAWKLLREGPGGEETEESTRLAGFLQRHLRTSPTWRGGRLTALEGGRRVLTPMLVVMVAIGFTDVLFALDSIPAIFGLTKEPFLVVSANAFALMGLRQLYFLVEGLLDRLVHLAQGLSVVLAFIAVKLVLEALHDNDLPFVNDGQPVGWAPAIPVWASLLFVIGALLVTTLTSLVAARGAAPTAPAVGTGSSVPDAARAGTDRSGDGQGDRRPERRGERRAERVTDPSPVSGAALGTNWPLRYGEPADPTRPPHGSGPLPR